MKNENWFYRNRYALKECGIGIVWIAVFATCALMLLWLVSMQEKSQQEHPACVERTELIAQERVKSPSGQLLYRKVKTASGYNIIDQHGRVVYRIVEQNGQRKVIDRDGRTVIVERI